MSEIRVTTSNTDNRELLIKLLTLESQWDAFVKVPNAMHILDEIVREVSPNIPEDKTTHDRLDFVLDYLYMHCGFSTTVQEIPESQLQSIAFAIYFRTGESINLGEGGGKKIFCRVKITSSVLPYFDQAKILPAICCVC